METGANWPGTFFAAQFSAGCIINTSGFDLRQAQRIWLLKARVTD